MRKQTRLVLAFLVVAAAVVAFFVWRPRPPGDGPAAATTVREAIPAGALLVATADFTVLRGSPLAEPFLGASREIPGVGKVREACGFDPLDGVREVALAIPAEGDSDFGLVAVGTVQHAEILACASKVIDARGGRAVVTRIGSFETVRDAGGALGGGEIAVRPGGPLLLGAGAYLRAMIDAADGRIPNVRASLGHEHLARVLGEPTVRITVALTPTLRETLAAELRAAGEGSSPTLSVLAGGLGLRLGETVGLHGVLACQSEKSCTQLASLLRARKQDLAAHPLARLAGAGAAIESLDISQQAEVVHLRVDMLAEQATALIDRLAALQGLSGAAPPAR